VKNPKLVAGLAVVVVVIIVGSFWMMRRGGEAVTIDLIGQLASAESRSTFKGTEGGVPFEVKDVAIGGVSRRAIYAPPFSRITYKVEVPRRGTLTTWFALREDGWTGDSDGVQFRIGVSDGRTYEEYLREFVNPKKREKDRRWYEATIDLSAYEGQQVEIVFNTDPGPRRRAKNTAKGDFAVWAEPKLASR
jgi:hypothetical protein